MSEPVTDEQAQAVLDAVVAHYRVHLEPLLDSTYGNVIIAADPPPVIQRDERGHALIVWEDGPDDWAHQATEGGSTEEERVLIADANVEFGANMKAAEPEALQFPPDVHVEPYNSYSLGVYPA